MIQQLFLLNSTLGNEEGKEMEKILYFFPEETPNELQTKTSGFCQALINFILPFTDEDCETIQQEKKKISLFQPEKNFWLIITYNCETFLDNQPSDELLHCLVKNAYCFFTFFCGKLEKNVDKNNFKEIFASYMREFIERINLKLNHPQSFENLKLALQGQ
eukprot:TRINITY_DN1115_c0_g1_i11.p1 TRINITY_DN1115_c0_g1~~TRINITY_DN1115_c0_g1_i11.p1  ORF type:complete len:161 (-),score=9.98 TRINITY_DN1115_c0_g1_i11:1014-1496(-)